MRIEQRPLIEPFSCLQVVMNARASAGNVTATQYARLPKDIEHVSAFTDLRVMDGRAKVFLQFKLIENLRVRKC